MDVKLWLWPVAFSVFLLSYAMYMSGLAFKINVTRALDQSSMCISEAATGEQNPKLGIH